MVKNIFSGFVFIAVLCGASGSSFAQDGKKEYEQAFALFEAEEYDAALPFFEKAYELSNRRPSTILGLAQCERALKLYDKAILHFEEFLRTKPEKEQAERVQETLRLTRIIVQSQKKIEPTEAPPAPPAATTRPASVESVNKVEAEEPSVWGKPWLWVVIGVVVVGGAAGTAFALTGEGEPYPGNTGITLRP